MPEPKDLPLLDKWNEEKLAAAVAIENFPPSGVQCPKTVTELLDVPGTEATYKEGGILILTVSVVCPECGFKGTRYK